MGKKDKKHALKVLTNQEINDALDYQNKNSNWSFYSERELLETVINQRINFLIAVFALFITAAASVETDLNLRIILSLGAVLIFMLFLGIYRIHIRLNIVQKILYKADNMHVLPLVQKEIKELKWKAFCQTTTLMHIWIPLLCFGIMISGIVASWWGWLQVGKD